MSIPELKLDSIKESPYQGRMIRPLTKRGKTDDPALKELEQSIAKQGLLTPIIVRPYGDEHEIIDGHRRVEVFKRLKMKSIPATIIEVDDEKAQAFSIIGNLHRQSLSAIEKAVAFKKIMDSGVFKTVKSFSKAIGKHETFVGDVLNTLEMDQRIIDDLADSKRTDDIRLLRAIRKADKAHNNKSDKQWMVYQKFIDEGLTRQQVLELVNDGNDKDQKRSPVRINQSGKSVSFKIKQVPADHIGEIQKMIEEYLQNIEG